MNAQTEKIQPSIGQSTQGASMPVDILQWQSEINSFIEESGNELAQIVQQLEDFGAPGNPSRQCLRPTTIAKKHEKQLKRVSRIILQSKDQNMKCQARDWTGEIAVRTTIQFQKKPQTKLTTTPQMAIQMNV